MAEAETVTDGAKLCVDRVHQPHERPVHPFGSRRSGLRCAVGTGRCPASPSAAGSHEDQRCPRRLGDSFPGLRDRSGRRALDYLLAGQGAVSGDVVVRPDGKISLPLLKDVEVAGYTPEQLTVALVKAASKYIAQPNVTVIVKEINSRKVFIIGQVSKPGAFPLTSDMTVLQLIALAGDVLEYAKSKSVVIVRTEEEGERRFKFNYKEVMAGKRVEQNILLKPGDTVIVP